MNRRLPTVLQASLIALALLSRSAPAWPGGAGALRVEADRLDGSIAGVSLEAALAAIATQTGLVIRVRGPADQVVTAEFHGVAIEDGLRALLRHADFLLVYETRRDGSGGRRAVLTEVHIYSAGVGGAAPGTPITGLVLNDGETTLSRRVQSALAARDTVGRRGVGDDGGRQSGALEALAEALEREEDAAVRESLVRALHRLRAPEAVPALARVALEDVDDDIREAAVHALGKTWTESALEPLILALGDARAAVRAAAAEALGGMDSEAAADALQSAAMDDPSARVRERALVALSQLGSAAAVRALTSATRDPSPRVQGIARDILGAIPSAGTP